MNVEPITSPEKIALCYDVFLELRPHFVIKEDFVSQVHLQQKEGYCLAAILKEEALAAIGFRIFTTLAWGKILYIDDLITKKTFRGRGYANRLLEYAINKAREFNCDQIHLDSGYTRHQAHRFYLDHGFELTSHHFSLKLKS